MSEFGTFAPQPGMRLRVFGPLYRSGYAVIPRGQFLTDEEQEAVLRSRNVSSLVPTQLRWELPPKDWKPPKARAPIVPPKPRVEETPDPVVVEFIGKAVVPFCEELAGVLAALMAEGCEWARGKDIVANKHYELYQRALKEFADRPKFVVTGARRVRTGVGSTNVGRSVEGFWPFVW